MTAVVDRLTQHQRHLVEAWLPGAEIVRDHSWGLVGTTVLQLAHEGASYIVKAGDENDHHLARELRAHHRWLGPWTSLGRAPDLVHADHDAKLLVTRYLPGELVRGTDHEWLPGTYRQAGRLLARLHEQYELEDEEFETREKEKALVWLDRPHRIPADVAARLRAQVESWPTPAVTVVPTHGDWHPRNWVVHDGVVSVIDFGRADLRPALTDFARLAAQQFRTDPALEAAFLHGYGPDPREPAAWHRNRVREAIGTAAWAYQVGDEVFERQGHRMIAEALATGRRSARNTMRTDRA
jgi:aminoglycoside/choline kinase family phosphotransferase